MKHHNEATSVVDIVLGQVNNLSFGEGAGEMLESSKLKRLIRRFTTKPPLICRDLAEALELTVLHKNFRRGNMMAAYNLMEDEIHMRPHWQFSKPELYIHTFFHELIHWTGAPTRLDRDFLLRKMGMESRENHIREELISDLGTLMLSKGIFPDRDLLTDYASASMGEALGFLCEKEFEDRKRSEISAQDVKEFTRKTMEETSKKSGAAVKFILEAAEPYLREKYPDQYDATQ